MSLDLVRKLPYNHPYRYDGSEFGGPKLWTPAADNLLVSWYDPYDEATITESGGLVSQLDDKSGNGNHLVQGTGSAQLTTGTRTINGYNVLDGDGTRYMEKTAFSTPASGDISIFGVCVIDAIDIGTDSLWSLNSTTNDMQFQANNGSQFDARIGASGIGVNDSATGGPYAGPSVFNTRFDFNGTGTYAIFVDGVQESPGATYTTKLDTPQDLQVFTNRAALQQPDGAFGEIILTEDVTTTTREKIEGYLAHKWGLAANLDAGHPYKTTPPTI